MKGHLGQTIAAPRCGPDWCSRCWLCVPPLIEPSYAEIIMPNAGGAHSDPQARPSEEMGESRTRRSDAATVPTTGEGRGPDRLPVLDYNDSTIGFVRRVVRTPQGKVQLIVNNGRFFGLGGRLVAVPIEVVAILARQIDILDMTTKDLDAAPSWSESEGHEISPNDTIQIALGRR